MSELQRSRLLSATVAAVEEFGYANVSVTRITSRARVSRRTFYELFDNREECLIAAFENTVALIHTEIVSANVGGLRWRERVRMGLWVILSFFDREPALARVCVLEIQHGGPMVLERRAEILTGLATIVDEGRFEGRQGAECTALIAEGLVGAVFAIVYGRLSREELKPLTDLWGELVGLILMPYIGLAAARREQARPAPPPIPGKHGRGNGLGPTADPLRDLPMRLTYRTVKVLESVAEYPGLSNRQLGGQAGIEDQGQVSKLLARLERLGLLTNTGEGHLKGEPNEWALTSKGEQVAQSIRAYFPNTSRTRASR